jgi:hypothetical protein
MKKKFPRVTEKLVRHYLFIPCKHLFPHHIAGSAEAPPAKQFKEYISTLYCYNVSIQILNDVRNYFAQSAFIV